MSDEKKEESPWITIPTRRGRSAQEGIDIAQRALDAVNTAREAFTESKGIMKRTAGGIFDVNEQFKTLGKGIGRLEDIANALGLNTSTLDEIKQILDFNGDGKVSDVEIANAGVNGEILSEVAKIHPVMARALRDKNFRLRKIEREPIEQATPGHKTDQVNEVLQGYAGYEEDVNKFNVNF